MPLVEADGVNVNFPFDPYPCQLDYMTKVINCLKNGYNGILESPTGTGKTLCLLCSSLAWLQDKKAQIQSQRWKATETDHEKNNGLGEFKSDLAQQLDQAAGAWHGELSAPKIIYASRTHSQLSQAIQELKRSAYGYFRVCVLGSREQLCIHPQVMKEEFNATKVHLCRAKVTARSCHFYNNVENGKENFKSAVMDIEDLVKLGTKHSCCPYYMARELRAEADVIFLPYNYLLDPKSRKAHGVELQGNVIIFDEAHNLERMCEESASFDLTSGDIASALSDLGDIADKLKNLHQHEMAGFDISASESQGAGQDFSLEEVLKIKAQLIHLESEIDNIVLRNPQEGITKPGRYIFEIFERVNLNFQSRSSVVDILDKMATFLTSDANSSQFGAKGRGLHKYSDAIKIIFSREPDDRANINSHQGAVSQHYKVHIHEETKFTNNKKTKKDGWGAASSAVSASAKPSRTLSYWCFSPGHAMEDLQAHGVRSILLTSGTLSPIRSFMSEMGIKFQVQLENPHVIEKHQIWVGTVGKGPDGFMLSSSYEHRFKPEYQASLGNAIVNFARVVPHGLLLFFPSYPVMDKCLGSWTNDTNVWQRIEQYKPIYVEPRNKHEFITAMDNFYDKIQDTTANGAVFAAVCRGKVSEGLDFADCNGRAVVITGLPFPPRMDPRVKLKMQYLDEMKMRGGKGLSGQDWYKQQASRAVNQAIGRVIRHKDDFGAIILCDTRFSSSDARAQLPGWVRPYVTCYSNFGMAIRDMNNFFKNAEKNLPTPGASKSKKAWGAVGNIAAQGACFPPSFASSSKAAHIQKASIVSAHVPSLKPSGSNFTEDVRHLAKLRVEYDGPQTSASSRGRGLLNALKSTEKPSDSAANFPGLDSQEPFSTSKQSQDLKKKKIVVKKTNTRSMADVSKQSLQSAEEYIKGVKHAVSGDTYKAFFSTLTAYKKDKNYEIMVTTLASMFTDSEHNYHLFKNFYRFVLPQHKQQFDEMCRNIIGEGCGFKPEHALPKKRHLSADAASSKEKKPKIILENMDSKATSKCDSLEGSANAHLDSKSHLNTAALSSVLTSLEPMQNISNTVSQKQTAESSTNSCISGGLKLTSTSDIGVSKSSKQTNPSSIANIFQKMGSSAQSDTSKAKKCSPHLDNVTLNQNSKKELQVQHSTNIGNGLKLTENVEESSKPLDDQGSKTKETIVSIGDEAGMVVGNTVGESEEDSAACGDDNPYNLPEAHEGKPTHGHVCCHCGNAARIPLKARCEHVCCVGCWKVIIGDHGACPACGKKVRRKHLARLYFSSGTDR